MLIYSKHVRRGTKPTDWPPKPPKRTDQIDLVRMWSLGVLHHTVAIVITSHSDVRRKNPADRAVSRGGMEEGSVAENIT